MCRITFDGPLVHIWCERCNSNEPILTRWKGWFWLSTSSIARVLVFFFGFYDSTFTIIFPCCWASNFLISVLLKNIYGCLNYTPRTYLWSLYYFHFCDLQDTLIRIFWIGHMNTIFKDFDTTILFHIWMGFSASIHATLIFYDTIR